MRSSLFFLLAFMSFNALSQDVLELLKDVDFYRNIKCETKKLNDNGKESVIATNVYPIEMQASLHNEDLGPKKQHYTIVGQANIVISALADDGKLIEVKLFFSMLGFINHKVTVLNGSFPMYSINNVAVGNHYVESSLLEKNPLLIYMGDKAARILFECSLVD